VGAGVPGGFVSITIHEPFVPTLRGEYSMNEPDVKVEVALRIPGTWSHPKELVERLPAGYRLTPEALYLPKGTKIEFNPLPPEEQFADIFRSSCRQSPTEEELAKVQHYSVNIGLIGSGGSLDAALEMMEAGAAIVKAGGAGVFIDNCALAHGGEHWLAMTEDGSPDAVSFAFVGIVRGQTEVWTMGMHVLGLREVVMKRADVEEGGFDIVEVIRYMARGDKSVADGHILADLDGPRFQVLAAESPTREAGTPMYNPFGRWKLVSVGDMAQRN
jgi:hypothetical protein